MQLLIGRYDCSLLTPSSPTSAVVRRTEFHSPQTPIHTPFPRLPAPYVLILSCEPSQVLCASSADHSVVKVIEPPPGAAVGARVTVSGAEGEPATPAQVQKKKASRVPGCRIREIERHRVVFIHFLTLSCCCLCRGEDGVGRVFHALFFALLCLRFSFYADVSLPFCSVHDLRDSSYFEIAACETLP